MATKTAIINVRIHKFRPIGAIGISADLNLGEHDPACFSQDGDRIKINIPPGSHDNIELIFRLPHDDRQFLLIGVAFTAVDFDRFPYAGQREFPQITIEKVFPEPVIEIAGMIRQLRVKDANTLDRSKIVYDYVLLVQDGKSGMVGVIDPELDPIGSQN